MKIIVAGQVIGEVEDFQVTHRRPASVNEISLRVNTCRTLVVWDEDFAAQQLESMMKKPVIEDRAFTDHVKKVQAEVAEKARQSLSRFVACEWCTFVGADCPRHPGD